jgi:hypothetical protein
MSLPGSGWSRKLPDSITAGQPLRYAWLGNAPGGRGRPRPNPHHVSEVFIAELRRLQWERIAGLMEKERMAAYVPSACHTLRNAASAAADDRRGPGRAVRCRAPEIWRHRVYRIDGRPTAGSPSPDMPAPAVHLMAASPGEAAARAWAIRERDGGLYQHGGYRIASVAQILPEPGELF